MDSRKILVAQMRKDRYNFREIGEKLGITRQRAFQILHDNKNKKDLTKAEKRGVL